GGLLAERAVVIKEIDDREITVGIAADRSFRIGENHVAGDLVLGRARKGLGEKQRRRSAGETQEGVAGKSIGHWLAPLRFGLAAFGDGDLVKKVSDGGRTDDPCSLHLSARGVEEDEGGRTNH